MHAIVMSGGANYGAMQASALEVLLEAGFSPEIAVGSSAGALNSLYFALDPSREGIRNLVSNWREVGPKEVGMPKILTIVRRLLTGQKGLIPSDALARFLKSKFPVGVNTFGELRELHGIRTYAAAVSMETGETVAFGDRDEDLIIDGAMASVAVPPYFPPWRVGECRYLDGGLTSKLPIQIAIERGATDIVALDIFSAMGSLDTAKNIITIGGYALSLMMEDQTAREINAARLKGVSLRVINLVPPSDIDFWDYDQVDRLIEIGREQAQKAIDIEPLQLPPKWKLRIRRSLASLLQRALA